MAITTSIWERFTAGKGSSLTGLVHLLSNLLKQIHCSLFSNNETETLLNITRRQQSDLGNLCSGVAPQAFWAPLAQPLGILMDVQDAVVQTHRKKGSAP